MRLESLALKGVLAFDREVRLDLRDVPPGIIAIVGAKGEGKTTLLEAPIAALDREFISRGKGLPITDYCGDHRDAFIDATFSLEGRGTYRARLNLDGLKGGSEAVLEHIAADGTRRALNDGKVSTFDVARAEIFPPRDVLLASAFASQNKRGSFITLGKGERKDLFAQLLGLEQYAAFAETARKAAAALDVKRAELRATVDRLDADSNDAITEQLATEANGLQAERLTAEDRARVLAGEIASLEAQLQAARAKAQRYAEALSALAAVQDRRRSLEADRDRATNDLAGIDQVFSRTRDSIIAQRDRRTAAAEKAIAALATIAALEQRRDRELAGVDAQLATDRKDRDERIRNNRTNLIDQADAIRAAVKEREALLLAKAEDQRQREAASARLRDVTGALAAARAAAAKLAPLLERIESARRGAALLETVPCGGAGDFASCQFLADARASKASITALEQKVVELAHAEHEVDRYESAEAIADSAVAEIDLRIEEFDRRLVAVETNALAGTPFKTLADRAAALDQAEQRITELEQDLQGLYAAAAARRAQIETDHAARVAERTKALADLTAERAAAVREAHAEIEQLEAQRVRDVAAAEGKRDAAAAALGALASELAAAEQAVATARVDQDAVTEIDKGLALARADHTQTQTALARLQARTEALEQRRTAVLAKRTEALTYRIALGRVDADAIEWEALVRVFGKDGLPVLEIDAAGPTVSAYTNELLQASFGSRFVVELVTQQAKKDGKGLREVFELKVWDAERAGQERDISDLSGGEQVVVDEALKSAIVIYLNHRNESPIRTAWRDETIGSLDPDSARRYMQMLRRVHELGGFVHLFLISHNLDAAAMADMQIRVADGAIDLQYAPFGAAA